MKKSIILEGANGSFKSTLAKELSKDTRLKVVHAGPNPGDTANAVKACMTQLSNLKRGCILDRCTPISRPIYDRDVIPELEVIIFNKRLEEMMNWAVIIYCIGEGEFINKSYYPKGHFDEVSENRSKIRGLYSEYMQGIDHIVYDGTNYKQVLKDTYEKLSSI